MNTAAEMRREKTVVHERIRAHDGDPENIPVNVSGDTVIQPLQDMISHRIMNNNIRQGNTSSTRGSETGSLSRNRFHAYSIQDSPAKVNLSRLKTRASKAALSGRLNNGGYA